MSQTYNPNAVVNRSTVTLHVVSSLDGFIARNDNSVSWLESTGEVYEEGVSEANCGRAHQSNKLLCAWFSHV